MKVVRCCLLVASCWLLAGDVWSVAPNSLPATITTDRADGRYLATRGVVQDMIRNLPAENAFRPDLTATEFPAWRAAFKKTLRDVLGFPNLPDAPDSRLISRERRSGYMLEKWEYYPLSSAAVPFLVLVPDGVTSTNPAPAVLCLPGTSMTKESSAGEPLLNDASDIYDRWVPENRMALLYCRAGFVAVAIDNPGVGEISDLEPLVSQRALHLNEIRIFGHQLFSLGWSYMGYASHNAHRLLQVMRRDSRIDRTRIAVSGHSLGAWMVGFVTALNDDVAAAVVNQGVYRWREAAKVQTKPDEKGQRPQLPGEGVFYVIPGMYRKFDMPDVFAAIAPRPLLLCEGTPERERLNVFEPAYRLAGASENLKIVPFAKYADVATRFVGDPPEGLSGFEELYPYYSNDAPNHYFKGPVAIAWLREKLCRENRKTLGAGKDVRASDYSSVSAAIAACHQAGGGRVVVAAGVHETGPVHLKSNVELHLEDGAELVFTDDERAYLPVVPTSWEGVEIMGNSPLVYGYGVTNAAITGKGRLCAKVAGWLKYKGLRPNEDAVAAKKRWGREGTPLAERDISRYPGHGMRPHFLQLNRCANVRLDGFSMRGSPFWMVHVYRCSDMAVKNLDICSWTDDGLVMNNSDGLDIEMSKGVTVEGCTFRQNDDAICLKAGKDEEGRRTGVTCEDILIRKCNVDAGHGLLVIGCEVSAGVRNVRVEDCTVNAEVNRLVFLKTTPARGGFIENVTVDGIRAKKVLGDAICLETRFYVGQPGEELPGARPHLTRIDGLTVRNVHCEWVKRLVTLLGEPLFPATNVTLDNVRADVAFEHFAKVENVDGIHMDVSAKKVFPDAQW